MKLVGRVIATLVTLACNPSRAETPKAKPKQVDPCSAQALKLGAATPLVTWKPPAGCTAKGNNGDLLRTKAAVDAQFDCTKGTVTIDLSKNVLIQIVERASPTTIGLDMLDDGKQLTLVTRLRSRCPNDPQTISMMTRWFLMPTKSGDRRLDKVNCLIETTCPWSTTAPSMRGGAP